MCNKKKEEPDVITVLFMLFAIIAIVAVIFTMFKLDCIGDNETVVYSFIGIIATFVVISNFAQMVEMRKDTEKRMDDMKEEHEYRLKELEETINRISDKIMPDDNGQEYREQDARPL